MFPSYYQLQFIVTPLAFQITASFFLKEVTKLNVQIAFVGFLFFVNLPLYMYAFKNRFMDEGDYIVNEMLANCSFILQSVFYFLYEQGYTISPQQAILIFVVLMNEFDVGGGVKFGHNIVTVSCFFAMLKIFTKVVEMKGGVFAIWYWRTILVLEWVVVIAMSMNDIWTQRKIQWVVGAVLFTLPISFPTTNLWKTPLESLQSGLFSFADFTPSPTQTPPESDNKQKWLSIMQNVFKHINTKTDEQ